MEGQNPVVCIFRLGRGEFPKGLEDAFRWVEETLSKTGLFKFRLRPRRFPPGSVAIFAIEGKAFAEAVLEEAIRDTTTEEREDFKRQGYYEYPRVGKFNPRSLRTYPKPLEMAALKQLGIKPARLFVYLSPNQYLQILQIAYAGIPCLRLQG